MTRYELWKRNPSVDDMITVVFGDETCNCWDCFLAETCPVKQHATNEDCFTERFIWCASEDDGT